MNGGMAHINYTFLVSSGSQIASWFPSFSVEVMHTRVDNVAEGQLPESRIEAMVRISIVCKNLRKGGLTVSKTLSG